VTQTANSMKQILKIFGLISSTLVDLTWLRNLVDLTVSYCGKVIRLSTAIQYMSHNMSKYIVRIVLRDVRGICLLIIFMTQPLSRRKMLRLQRIISHPSAGIFKQSIGARNRVGKELSYRPARLQETCLESILGLLKS
jgi:hypothetical protein